VAPAQVVVYVTREHPVSGADQLLLCGGFMGVVPKGSVEAAERSRTQRGERCSRRPGSKRVSSESSERTL
jgi:hypothetical protein